ncbi:MAG: GerMN domain-containing protein [Intrasporangium sp.]|uniref:Gmad2 immunoglobulin-like domain-containing protein n=1 Tax=Intrasporangium sp. TaxID=1925024 RepID=UPI002649659D|nr:Gmad2 immunoglobulin-like domain-containing protein [Intrasporangium sp.]MDN5796580.1 GerMN domain-containing protein [Intrasporangium sp.]
MSNDDPNPGERPEDEPIVIGAGLRHIEESVRAELHREADRIQPHDRLDAILAEAHRAESHLAGSDPVGSGRHRWLLPVAAAALAGIAALGVWIAKQAPTPPPPAATQTTATQTATTTTEGTPTSAQPTSSAATSAPVVTTRATVPVYYVGSRTGGGTGSTALVLFREFTPADVAAPGDAASKAKAALERAVGAGPADASYQPMWEGVRVEGVSEASGEIRVTLSTGARGLSESEARIAVQQLVWTATAAVGKGNLPVRFALADGSTTLAGDLTTGQTYTRPTGQMAVYEVLSPIWIDEPSRDATLKTGRVTVSGIASTFEANVQWKIVLGGQEVASGHTTAKEAGPARAAYSFTTDPLPAGDYVVQVFETSPKDGSVSAMATMPFTLK